MRLQGSAIGAAIALVAFAPLAVAQQGTTRNSGSNVNSCIAGANVVQYSNGDVTTTVSKTTGNVYVRDTSTKEVRANVGGGSVAQSKTNQSSAAQVDATNKVVVVDSSKLNLPGLNSERTAVRANVGGGSTPITRTNQVNTNIRDSTKAVTPGSCPTPDRPSRKH
jgi:hypothetical protein